MNEIRKSGICIRASGVCAGAAHERPIGWKHLVRAYHRGAGCARQAQVESAPVIAKQGEWIAASSPVVANRTIAVTHGPYTLCEVGVYTLEDWAKLYDAYQRGDIAYPWVAGPRNATMAGEIGPWEL